MSFEQTDEYGKFTDKFKTKLSGRNEAERREAERREAERRELSGKELELLRNLG